MVTHLKYSLATTLMFITLLVLTINGNAQGVDSSLKTDRNTINAYIGLFDANINYERNIIQSVKSHSNLRVGLGYAMLFNAGEGTYFNTAFVHLIGKGSSHLEIDLGLKYMLTNSIEDPDFSDILIPDIFFGYRYEKPSGGFIFRFGLNYPTIVNLGMGYKF